MLGQNLVSNGSFVELDTCDLGTLFKIFDVKDWQSTYYNLLVTDPYGSSDYYSNCTTFPNHGGEIPQNDHGYQWPRSLDHYAGVFNYTYWNYREGIQNHLVQPLDSGVTYCFTAYVSLADVSALAMDRFEVLLTENKYLVDHFRHDTTVEPSITILPGYIQDKVSWTKIEGTYVAQGGERWLSLLNFSSNDTLSPLVLENGAVGWDSVSYYYIDDVSLYPCNTPTYNADAGNDQSGCKGDVLDFSTPYRNHEYYYFWMDELGDTLSTNTTLRVEVNGNAEYYLAQWDFKYDLTWDTVRVVLDYCPELELPNVFTPNSDGNNDFWEPIAEDIDQIEIIIYSRWGNQVFSYSGSYNDFGGWSPNEVPEGMYYVLVKATAPDGRTLQEKGSITLLR